MSPSLLQNQILAVRRATGSSPQREALQACCTKTLHSPAILKEYHEALLFVCAYPANKENRALALSELKRIAGIVKNKTGFRWQHSLAGSGLPWTELRCQYSRALLAWLMKTCPGQVHPAEANAPAAVVKQLFQLLLPAVEFSRAVSGDLSAWKRIRNLSGQYFNRDALDWLTRLIDQQEWPLLMKDQVYDQLNIYISWRLTEEGYNRSYLHWPVKKIYYHPPAGKKRNSRALLNKPLGKPARLGEAEKQELISVARASLAFYYRETDPFTYAAVEETKLFEMGGGVQIALIGMEKERRLSLDSYVGFMAFRNGIPVSYGGGWIFGHRCKIGVNIYPPFRGGDSAGLFCQVLRLYYQYYRVHSFIVKPYQFGKGNPEGLKSGAFWFYYKLGFRPLQEQLSALALSEWKKINRDPAYRSPLPVLRKLAEAPVEWVLEKKAFPHPGAAELSRRISDRIRDQFGGDRAMAIRNAVRQCRKALGLKKATTDPLNPAIWENWALVYALLANGKDPKENWLTLFRLRFSGKDRDFVLAWQRYKRLWDRSFQ